jgi:hypothetical protein
VRIRLGLVLALALLTTVPAEAARDVFVRDSPRSAVATCLRPTGAPGLVGMLGPLERQTSPYDLLRVDAGGVSVAATARLGVLGECPAVAADPSGHAIVAGAVLTDRGVSLLRAALAPPGGGFGAAVDIARSRAFPMKASAAISPRGDAVVAWPLVRDAGGDGPPRFRTRVVVVLRPAGGEFGRPQFLTPWRRGSFLPTATASAGMDAAGTATVAWSQPIPGRGNIPSLETVGVATARAGGGFGPPQVLASPVQDTQQVALAVGQEGRALLAHDGQDTVQVFERGPGAAGFARVRRWRGRGRRAGWERPEVALAPDGSAVVAWRGNQAAGSEDVFLSSRSGAGAWTAPLTVQRSRAPDATREGISFITYGFSGPSPPSDFDGTALQVVLGAGGCYLVSWARRRETPLGYPMLEARAVHGRAGESPSRPEAAGCPCRPIDGVMPLALAGGEPVLAYTDNLTRLLVFGLELPRASGRLHVAVPGRPARGPAPPRLKVRPPGRKALGYGERVRVRVGCDRACDIRAYVVSGEGRARGLATATLRGAGVTRLTIRPPMDQHLVPPSGGRARLVVHGYAANGRRPTRHSVRLELSRKRVRPLPRLLNVRAVRQGRSVLVTWQTDIPAPHVIFDASAPLSRRGENRFVSAEMDGGSRRRYRLRLRGVFDTIELRAIRHRPPYDSRRVVVDVSG